MNRMNAGTAYQNGDVTEFPIPKPDGRPADGKIVDEHGDTLTPSKEAHGLMVRVDNKAAEKVELRKGTIAAVAIVPVVFLVALNYGATAVGWIRSDEGQRLQLQQVQNDVTGIQNEVKSLRDLIEKERDARHAKELQEAKALGYQLKAAEGPEHGAKK